MTDTPVTPAVPPTPVVAPVDGVINQTPAEKAAALASAQQVAAGITAAGTAQAAASRAAANAEIAKLKKDPEFAEKLLKGDVASTQRWRELHRSAAAAPEQNANDELVTRISALQKFGFPSLDSPAGQDLLKTMAGAPISIEVRRQVEARRSVLMGDKAFVERYLSGDQEARKQMVTISVLMAAQVERRTP
jgi:hypothetical protein